MRRNAKQLIADALVESVKKTSLSETHIADIITGLELNRNTFYYHFSNKYQVAFWVFLNDMATELSSAFNADELVYLSATSDVWTGKSIPYYVHVENGAHSLDASGFLKVLTQCVVKDREFYRKLFNKREIEFMQGITTLYQSAIENDIKFILGGRYMPQETFQYLATVGTQNIITAAEYSLSLPSNADILDERVNPFWNFFHESLSAAILNHPIARYSSSKQVAKTIRE